MSTHACAHLHVHSEYSLLDGAAQHRRPRRPRGRVRPARARPHRPRRDERHRRALQGLQEARHQADPRPRGLLRRRPHGPRGQDRAQPPDAARRRPTRASRTSPSSPAPASSRACYRGKPGVDLELLERHAEGVIALTGCLASRSQPPDRRGPPPSRPARTSTSSSRSSAPRTSTSRSSATASPSRSRSTRRSRSFAQEMGRPLVATADVHYLRRRTTTTTPRCCACRRSRRSPQPKMTLRHQRVLFEELGGDGGVVRRHAGGARLHARDRRALRHHDRARAAADPALRHARTASREEDVPPGARRPRACASATATRSRPPPASAPTWSSASSATWASTPTS